jgi:hypothetical protein
MVLVAAVDARTETFDLEMKRLPSSYAAAESSEDAAFLPRSYQAFYTRFGSTARTSGQSPFNKVVTKEPKYKSANPLKGVAKLGSQEFGFALDVVPAKSDKPKATTRTIRSSTVRYTHLYFDCNGNGDLTDDQVVEVDTKSSPNFPPYTFFPRVDVTLDVDGTKLQYAFYLRTYPASSSYGYALLYGAAYRHAEITLNGEKRRIVVVDSNSNARFDDETTIRTYSGGRLYPSVGDTIFVDPDPSKGRANNFQQPVGKLLNIAGSFYDMKLSPAGDQLTLTPSSVPVGYVSNSNKGVGALVHGDQGILGISVDDSGKSPLPVGQWKLLSYTINHTAKTEEEGSLLNTLSAALVQSSSFARTYVSARAKNDYTAVTVREGETVDLPFGPPYKPIVKASRTAASGSASNRTAYLSLSLVGTGGELVSDLRVNGSRPEVPEFTITSAEEKVAQGKFRYG